MELVNSSLKKGSQLIEHLSGISSKKSVLTWWSWAILNVKWKAYQRSLISKQEQLLYLIALTAGSFCFLTQFMRSHGPPFLFVISWIFWSKNEHFVLLTIFLNCFQSSKLLVNLYFSRSLLQFKSHQLFEYMVILTIFEFLFYISSMVLASKLMTFSTIRHYLSCLCQWPWSLWLDC